jgi:hypothetical protein
MNKSDEQKIDEYLNHMINKSIIGCGINDDDEFEIALDDGSVIVFFSDDHLGMVIEYGGKLN